MASSTTNKAPFHTYENVGYEEQANNHSTQHYVPLQSTIQSPPQPLLPAPQLTQPQFMSTNTNVNCNSQQPQPQQHHNGININPAAETSVDSPFPDPMVIHDQPSSAVLANNNTAHTAASILSTASSATGTTRMLTTSKAAPGQNLVTKLVVLPAQSPMDQIKEWSVSTYKCTKQFLNEKRGTCSITNDAQLITDIEQLRDNRGKLIQMLRTGQQMTNHYTQLVRTQKQLYGLMNEMSIKCFTSTSTLQSSNSRYGNGSNGSKKQSTGKQIVANFSSLGNNLSSSTTTNERPNSVVESFEDFLPVLNHMQSFSTNLIDDFKKNAMSLSVAIKNGEKLIAALNFYCSNLSTLINKTIEDTLTTVKQYESSRLEYDAERNSLNFISPSSQASMTYSSDRLEIARLRYEQLKEEVQIKLKFLEENTIKVMHKQLSLFNGAFASYTSGNTAALDSTLKQFSIR